MDIRDELEKSPLTLRHWIVVAVLGLVTLFDGYDTFAPSYVLFHPTTWESSKI